MEELAPNELESGLMDILTELKLGENQDEVAAGIVNFIVDFFETGGDQTLLGNHIDNAFSSLINTACDRQLLINFLYQVVAFLRVIKSARSVSDCKTGHEVNRFWEVDNCIRICINSLDNLAYREDVMPITRITQEARAIDPQLALSERVEIISRLKEKLLDEIAAGRLFKDHNLTARLSFENIDRHFIAYFKATDGEARMVNLDELFGKILYTEREVELRNLVGSIDRAEFAKNTKRFGAKGANLIAMNELLVRLEGTVFSRNILIPEFDLIETDVYVNWLEDNNSLGENLREIYTKWQGKAIMVRSSAVYSEDSERITGAGKYESVPLPSTHSFEDFLKAVTTVYESVNSKDAVKYRSVNGISEESMGIVVQEKVDQESITVESTRPYSKNVIEVPTDLMKLVIDKNKLNYAILVDGNYRRVFKVTPDHNKLERFDCVCDELVFIQVLEMYYGQPLQVEYASERGWGEDDNVYFFQARPLPDQLYNFTPIEFPTGLEPIFECLAEGVCDVVLDVLPVHEDNEDKRGFVVVKHSFGASQNASLRRAVPSEGAVFVVQEGKSGHIETLALERGVVLLYTDHRVGSNSVNKAVRARIIQCLNGSGLSGPFLGQTKVRLVANGEIAKIYEVEEGN